MSMFEPAAATALPDEFWSKLELIYSKNENLADYWAAERPLLERIFGEVADKIAFNYEIRQPLGVGGSGIVVVATDKNLGTDRALKVARPSPGKEVMLARFLEQETQSLRRLSHQNLIRIFAQGVASGTSKYYPFYVMEFVPGAKDADEYLVQPGRTEADFLRVLDGVLAAIEYLHSQKTIHMDIKPGNVLVTPDGHAILSDLGFAKQLRMESGHTLIGGTDGYIHPEARRFVEEHTSDPNRMRGQSPRAELDPRWDLYSLGKTVLVLLNAIATRRPEMLRPYTKRFIRLLACRLLDGRNSDAELVLGLQSPVFEEIKYTAVSEARTDLQKLVGSYNLDSRLPELDLYIQDTIQVSTVATTPFSNRVRGVIEDPAMMRLGACTQLGLVNLVYTPGTHSRLEHSMGTFSIMCRYVRALYSDPLNPLFRQLMNEEDLRAVLLAALLHDVGQYPMAHDLEEAEYQTFSHKELGARILSDPSGSLERLLSTPQSSDGWEIQVSRIQAILTAEPATLKGTFKDRILHSLIDGPIDADKLDYLKRDSRRLGLKYGDIIDFERLLRCLTIIVRPQDRASYAALGLHEKGKIPAEAVAFARYAMFGQVYWHHAYRAVKAMVHRLVWGMLQAAKDDGSLRAIKEEFQRFVLPGEGFLREGSSLFPDGPGIYADSQLDRADMAVLGWIAKRSDLAGREIFKMLQKRKLYKRVLVLSRDKPGDKQLWDRAFEFYKKNGRQWGQKLKLQQDFQRRLGEMVDAAASPAQTSVAITPSARNAFIADARGGFPVVLIDFPAP